MGGLWTLTRGHESRKKKKWHKSGKKSPDPQTKLFR
jgi:hypothetical protein